MRKSLKQTGGYSCWWNICKIKKLRGRGRGRAMLSFRLIRGGCVCSSNTSSSTDGLAETWLHPFTFQQPNTSFLRKNIYINQRECLCKLLRNLKLLCKGSSRSRQPQFNYTFAAFFYRLCLSLSFPECIFRYLR